MPTDPESLNVIGLISGGKDSIFSLLHCLANHHSVLALANVYPAVSRGRAKDHEDLNSFMYQTAGHALIPLYSVALGLPLYRQEITGLAFDQSKDYDSAHKDARLNAQGGTVAKESDDETESLIPLLEKVTAAHPTANAICTGAILSTYQRTRIEYIARRLNLIPLSYLWQYPSLPPPSPGSLLEDLAGAGFEVRLVKVASGGLDDELLWGNLMEATVRGRVQKAVDRFGGSLLGEGGEYETLVVDGPWPFWKGRIEVCPEDMWTGTGGGGEVWLGFREGSGVVLKENGNDPVDSLGWNNKIRIPPLWDEQFEGLHIKVPRSVVQCTWNRRAWKVQSFVCKCRSHLSISNITAQSNATTAEEQMMAINSNLLSILSEYNIRSADHIVFTTILLRTMADFASVNDVYGQLFTRPNPPARVNVACGNALPPGVQVMVTFIVGLELASRDGLHVQSRSYWAPANIGPYSQAISIPFWDGKTDVRLVYVAGQIPLIPASMKMLKDDEGDEEGPDTRLDCFQRQTTLALQHLWRIGKAMNVSWWTDATAFVVGNDDIHAKALVAWKTWEAVHQAKTWANDTPEEDDSDVGSLDVWDLKYGGLGTLTQAQVKCHRLPDFSRSTNPTTFDAPPFFAVQVYELPRGCNIEWQSSGIAYHHISSPTVRNAFSYISIPWEDSVSDAGFQARLMHELDGRQLEDNFDAKVYTPWPDLVKDLPMQVIPCMSVWGPAAQRLAAGIVIQNDTWT